MNLTEAVVLGVVQGLTEFLPVSSSGHLVLFQNLLGLKEPLLAFDISVHVGTLFAVVIYFFKDIIAILKALVKWLSVLPDRQAATALLTEDREIRIALLIITGSIPTAILGLLFKNIAETLFSSVTIVGVTLIITGIILWATRWISGKGHGIRKLTVKNSFAIGVIQGLAILPGISRSGSTIAAGLWLGLDRETAARYSFLLSIPAVAGAGLLGVGDLIGQDSLSTTIIATGTLVSCIVGYASLKLLVWMVRRGRLHFFAPYCAVLGCLALIISL
ncbi:MAG: undecaprenyl-diphosphate phosphatase [Desulfobacterales bacterium]|nr:undecaprenyl-diphosphate phosphatase [Desulfobacterales bacterium]